jgi:hypothetical protein
MEEKIKPLLTVSAIAIVAIVGIVLFVNTTTTGAISSQQKIPYSTVFGPQPINPCSNANCPTGTIAEVIGTNPYTNEIMCQCQMPQKMFYETPSYVVAKPMNR